MAGIKKVRKKRKHNNPKRIDAGTKEIIRLRIAQGASFTAVGREYGLHHEQVKRIWNSVGEEEQEKIQARAKEVTVQVSDAIEQLSGNFEERVLNIAKPALIEALGALANRIHNSQWQDDGMTDKDLAGAIKLLHGITSGQLKPKKEDEDEQEQGKAKASEVDKIYDFFSKNIDKQITQ